MKLKLVKIKEEAKGTKSFFWQPSSPVSFKPGQYFYYTLPKLNYPDDRGATRHFTIASSPIESPLLQLTTRIREESGYKKTLDELPIGSVVEGQGPNGTFIFPYSLPPNGYHIFIAGGIGITPFRSMINYNLTCDLKIPMYLLYSNSNEDEVTFNEELTEWDKKYDYFTMQQVITSRDGRINENLIRSQFGIWHLSFDIPTYWLCGPPPFIDAMETILESLGVTSDKIRSEKFTGY